MKKITPIIWLLMLATSAYSQSSRSNPILTKQDYLKKSRNQKLTAWVLLGGGTITWLAGVSKNMNQDDNIDGGGEVTMIAGGIAVLSSIPFFIMASKNKKKATALSFRMEKAPAVQKQNIVNHSYPAISIHFTLQ